MKTDFETLVCKIGMCPGDHCPHCSSCLKGHPIPEPYHTAGWYGDKTHYSRRISIYDRETDRTVSYKCPDCNASWAR